MPRLVREHPAQGQAEPPENAAKGGRNRLIVVAVRVYMFLVWQSQTFNGGI